MNVETPQSLRFDFAKGAAVFEETEFLPHVTVNAADVVAACRPLTRVFKWLAINLDVEAKVRSSSSSKGEDDEGGLMKFYRSFVTLVHVVYALIFGVAIYDVFIGLYDDVTPTYLRLFYLEPLIGLTLVVSFARHRQRLSEIVATLVTIILTLDTSPDRAGLRAVRKCAVALSVTAVVVLVVGFCLAGLESAQSLILIDADVGNSSAHKFSLTVANHMDVGARLADSLLYSVFVDSFSDVYGLFQMFICYLLYRCYRQLNLFLGVKELVKCRQVHQVQFKHQEIAEHVDAVNQLLSVGIFFFSAISTIKMTVALKSLPDEIFGDIRTRSFFAAAGGLFTFIRTIGLFAGTTLMASRVFVEAQDTITVMLTTSLQNQTSRPKDIYQTKDIKECHVTTLFLAQRTLSPVGIKGLNIFTINYGFLVIVISTVVTYVSTLSSFAEAGEKRAQKAQ